MISLQQQPSIFTSSENPIVWKLNSNISSLVYIKVDVLDQVDNLIASFKYYPRPDFLTGVIVDISEIAQSVVRNNFFIMSSINTSTTDNIFVFKIRTTEYYLSGTSLLAQTFGNYFVYRGRLNSIEFLNPVDFYLNSNNKGRFLTKNKMQRISKSFEGRLNFIVYQNSQNISVVYENSETGVFHTHAPMYINSSSPNNVIKSNRYHHFNTSYLFVAGLYGDDLKDYKVSVYSGSTLLDSIQYIVQENNCKEKIQITFENQYGAWDSIELLSPKYDYNYTKTTMKTNALRLNSDGSYANNYLSNSNIIFNPSEKQLSVDNKIKLTAYTNDLTDSEILWLKDLYSSKQIYIKIHGKYIPALLDDAQYSTDSKRKNGGVAFKKLSFTLNNEIE